MTWEYDYRVAGEDLTDFMYGVRIIPETAAPHRTQPLVVPHVAGRHPAVVAAYDDGFFVLKGLLRGTAPGGTVTHTNGAAGHLEENWSNVKRLFSAARGPVTVTRVLPHSGEVQAEVIADGITTGAERSQIAVTVPCRMTWPFWRSTDEQTATVNGAGTVPVEGDAPQADMILRFSAAGRLTHNDSGDFVEILGGGATTVNLRTRTIRLSAGGADNSANFVTNVPWWQHWDTDGDPVPVTTTVTVHIDWRDQTR